MSDFDDLTHEGEPESAAVASEDLADRLEAASERQITHEVPVTIELTATEARVVGSLIEKEFLTPDIYPMTTNAIVTACNQKTNRDPVMDLRAVDVDGALMELRQRNIVRRVHSAGARSTKHRQTLNEVLSLNPGQLAVVSVLLLRGQQTIGELRTRTERQHGFSDTGAVEDCLRGLAARSLVAQLERQPGHKEARWQHLLGDPASEPATIASPVQVQEERVTYPPTPTGIEPRVAALEEEVAKLRGQLEALADLLGESL